MTIVEEIFRDFYLIINTNISIKLTLKTSKNP